MAVKRSTRMFKSHPDSSRVRQDQPDLVEWLFLFGSTKHFAAFAGWNWGILLSSPFLTRERILCIRVYIFCVRIWSRLWVILRRFRLFCLGRRRLFGYGRRVSWLANLV